MNPALFQSIGEYHDVSGVLTLPVRETSIPGSSYRFMFPVINPINQRSALNFTLSSTGVYLSPLPMTNAPDPLGPVKVVSCSQGTYNPDMCIPCPAGTYAMDCGVSTCVACNPGQYSSIGASICSECPYGTFSEYSGSTICQACPIGKYGNVTGAISEYDGCLVCEAGKFSDNFHQLDSVAEVWNIVGATVCDLCPRGFYCLGGGSKISCPDGTWSDVQEAANVSVCSVCSRPELCTNQWPRYVCHIDEGYAKDIIFYDLRSCSKVCISAENQSGQCLYQTGQNNGCSLGYDGPTCNKCNQNYYPDFIEGQCQACPSEWREISVMAVFAMGVLVLSLFLELFGCDWRISAYFRSILIFLEFQDMLLALNTRWPDFMMIYVNWLHLINFRISSTKPECFVDYNSATWLFYFRSRVLYPLFAVGILSVCSNFPLLGSYLKRSISRFITAMVLWYSIPFFLSLISAFNCVCVSPGNELQRSVWNNCSKPKSRPVLIDYPYISCTDTLIQSAMEISFWFLFITIIPIPAALFFIIPQNKEVGNCGLLHVNYLGRVLKQNNVLVGNGWLYTIKSELVKSQKLLSAVKLDLNRLYEIQLDEQAQGHKKEYLLVLDEYEKLRQSYQSYTERHEMFSKIYANLKDSLDLDRSLSGPEIKNVQIQAIRQCRHRVNSNITNFVHTLQSKIFA